MDITVSPPSPSKPTHSKPTLDEILSSLSSTSSDHDDELSDSNSSSSVEDVTHLFKQNSSQTPIHLLDNTFDVELPVGIQFPPTQTPQYHEVANIVGKNIRDYRKTVVS